MNVIKRFLFEEKKASTAKVALWYLVCNVIVSGLGFLTTPIFSRILTKAEYGQFSNFLSWEAILSVIVTLNLAMSITRAKYDFQGQFDSYVYSVLVFSNLITLLLYGGAELFPQAAQKFLSMDMPYVRLLFLDLFFWSAFRYLQVKYRITVKYKLFVIFSVMIVFFRITTALLLIRIMDDRLLGRTLGYVLPAVAVCALSWAIICRAGKRINLASIRYGCKYSIPLIPHTLSGHILGSSDKVMIKQIYGSEAVALYAIPYTVSSIAAIVWVAMNEAWAPWLYDRLYDRNREAIRSKSKWYLGIFGIVIIGVLLLAPDILYLMGGKPYMEAANVMPPVILGCAFQFVYGMYVNIEMYMKRGFQISLATTCAAVFNLVTNFLFLPRFGYVAAAYTTLVGYFLLLAAHYILVKVQGDYADVYDDKFILMIVLLIVAAAFAMFPLYQFPLLRRSIAGIYAVVIGLIGWKYRERIFHLLK